LAKTPSCNATALDELASQYLLVHDGHSYDSKAIAGAAHAYQFPQFGQLRAADFSGGEATVASKLPPSASTSSPTEPIRLGTLRSARP
jgi:hypothetical protein